tara:strand:- start:265 stop:474 length:210 start_codon:yes stop_codon:yes gene_type:complete
MMILNYQSKKALKAEIGSPLNYTETSFYGDEYKRDGQFVGCNRPSITNNGGREFFAQVTMRDGLIKSVK